MGFQDTGDPGPLVGRSQPGGGEVRLPESSVRRHTLILGGSGVGKSTLLRRVLAHRLRLKAEGRDDDAIVVIDSCGDLARDTLRLLPPFLAHRVRFLDFGDGSRVPAVNFLDPSLFPDRDRCVDGFVSVFRQLWDHWGARLEDIVRRGLSILYEFNFHLDTPEGGMLTVLDLPRLLGCSAAAPDDFQSRALSRVSDPALAGWFRSYAAWDPRIRAEASGPVSSCIGAYSAGAGSRAVLGQRRSAVDLDQVLPAGMVLLVSTGLGRIGPAPSALVGGAVVGLLEHALRGQWELPESRRRGCLLVCDDFQAVAGVDWGSMLAEARKYGASLMLAAQSLAGLGAPERRLNAGILGNVGVLAGCRMSPEDARIIAPEMDGGMDPERFGERDLVNLAPFRCVARVVTDSGSHPAFAMDLLPPPEEVPRAEGVEGLVLDTSRSYTAAVG